MMRPAPDDMLTFPIERIEDQRLKAILRELAEGIVGTNDPSALRALGQSLKIMGDLCRSLAYQETRSNW